MRDLGKQATEQGLLFCCAETRSACPSSSRDGRGLPTVIVTSRVLRWRERVQESLPCGHELRPARVVRIVEIAGPERNDRAGLGVGLLHSDLSRAAFA
jgi:hypothetical protein